jgi:hypothetical protein
MRRRDRGGAGVGRRAGAIGCAGISECGPPGRSATICRMTTARTRLTRDDLAPLTRAALSGHRALAAVSRLRGGSKKGVYRLFLDDGSTAVAYVWSPDEDYWDAGTPDHRDPFSHGTGLDLFTAARPVSCTPTPPTATSRRTRPSWRTSPATAWRTP